MSVAAVSVWWEQKDVVIHRTADLTAVVFVSVGKVSAGTPTTADRLY